jgi:hypothetical protein
MPNGLKLYLDQMFGLDVATALRREGHDVVGDVVNLLLPFLRLHSSLQFKDHLVILSAARAEWVLTSTSSE